VDPTKGGRGLLSNTQARGKNVRFDKSLKLQEAFRRLIPGGSHTYAKGDDQYPERMPPYITRGEGCRVWDIDGNEFIEYGMGLRAVTLGHAFGPVLEAVQRQLPSGSNFCRPNPIELECAQELVDLIPGAEMAKFAKNGSDVTSAAIRVSRAYTGRDMVAVCRNHPFYSNEDWFIGSTAMRAGVPESVRTLTVTFQYNDMESVREIFEAYPDRIACVILEPEKEDPPKNGFLRELGAYVRAQGAVFILDEMITGFRWHNAGAQSFHGVEPDLSTWGKALGNGYSVSALLGKREIMELGGYDHDRERVFLLSYTHGAEPHGLAAALETMRTYQREPVVETLWRQGERLQKGVNQVVEELDLGDHFSLRGRPCCLVFATRDQDREPSQPFRTLFLQETLKRGLLAPSLVVSYSHRDDDIDQTVEIIRGALGVYRQALDDGVERYLDGRPVKPAFRPYA
jgi:glutamate-1-semialdehyde 2,1-aminomutase